MAELRREFDVPQLILLGISNIIGAGIYVVGGLAAGIAGPSVILSFIVASFVATLTALIMAELSSAITDVGESYTYARKAFGNYIGFVVGIIRFLSSVFSTAAVAIGFSVYLIAFFLPNYNSEIFVFTISAVIILISLLFNSIGISKMIKLASVLTLFKILALSFFIFLGLYFILNNFDNRKLTPLFPNGLKGMIEASTLVFFAYIGFQTIALASGETKKPERDIPLAIFFTMLFCSIFYILIILVQICTVEWEELGKVEYSLLYVTRKITENYFANILITSSALAAMLSVLLTTVYSSSRIIYAMAKDGLMPNFLSNVDRKYRTPITSLLISALLSILILSLKNLSTIISFVNFGYLFIFLLTNLSLIKLKKKIKPKFELPFYPLIPILASLSIILLLLFLESLAKILGLAFIIIASLIYFLVVKKKIEKDV